MNRLRKKRPPVPGTQERGGAENFLDEKSTNIGTWDV